jgi:hypothetical protein
MSVTIDEFWDIVDRTAHKDNSVRQELLRAELRRLPADTVAAFYKHFHNYMIQAYNHELWAAAYIIGDGCGDDCFSDFRAWLISAGRNNFENILASPELLIGFDQGPDDFFNQDYQYIPWQVYKEMTGEMPARDKSYPENPLGQEWERDNVSSLYPALAEKYDKYWDKFYSEM